MTQSPPPPASPSAFCARLGLRWPIVQAPMAGAQGHALAAAVCGEGALGSLPAAMLSVEALRQEMQALRARGAGAFNVNFFCHLPPRPNEETEAAWRALLAPYFEEAGLDLSGIGPGAGREPFGPAALALLQEQAPAVVSFHFGLPAAPLLAGVKATGAQVWASATTVEEALHLQAHGADAVIAQGLEAGGHRGHFLSDDLSRQIGTLALLTQLQRALTVPVIAAGGIADEAGVRAALAAGAAAVQVGTAYLLCDEALTSPAHRAALQTATARHTALTNLFTGRPARGIVNRLMREIGPLNPAAPAFPLAGGALAPLRAWAEARGLGDFSPLWAGQNTSGSRAVSAAQITRALAAGCA